jgi:hypothetical protein
MEETKHRQHQRGRNALSYADVSLINSQSEHSANQENPDHLKVVPASRMGGEDAAAPFANQIAFIASQPLSIMD